MGEDERTLYLVFSGNDSFSLRKATFTLAKESHPQTIVPTDEN
jgi:hypothetical protein